MRDLVVLVGLLAIASEPAAAATWSVASDGTGDFGTIQGAIDSASSGDTIEVEPGTWAEHIDFSGKNLWIIGLDGAEATTIEGNEFGALVHFSGGEGDGGDAILEGFTLVNDDGPAVLGQSATMVLRSVIVEGLGDEEEEGGAIHARNGGVTIDGCTLDGNQADLGGAIYAYDSWVTITDSVLEDNSANYGGAIYMEAGLGLTISDSTVSDNEAYYDGGAIYTLESPETVAVSGSTFFENRAAYGYGGAIYQYTEGDISVTESTFEDNFAYYYGGAIYSYDRTDITITSSELIGNSAYYYGGAIYFYPGVNATYGTLTIHDSSVTDSESVYSSVGAIYCYYYANLVLTDSIISDNVSASSYGAVYHYYGSAQITGNTFEGNIAEGAAGALYTYPGWNTEHGAVISDNVFSGNVSELEGAALVIPAATGPTTISGNTFDRNQAGEQSYAGAMLLTYMYDLQVTGNTFTANSAAYGGAVYYTLAQGGEGKDTWTHNIFQDNVARFGGAMVLETTQPIALTNNTFVGNQALDEGGTVYLYDAQAWFTNTILSYTVAGGGVVAYDDASRLGSRFRYCNLYDNTDGSLGGTLVAWPMPADSGATDDTGDTSTTDTAGGRQILGGRMEASVHLAPGFAAWTNDGDHANDVLVLAADSPLIDAGDPDILDADGSRSDIGAMGGPDAPLAGTDTDGDGYDATRDCDDEDASIHPGATETWYDGTNTDCLSGSDYDADGDGLDSSDHDGDDCDDTDADVLECQPGEESTSIGGQQSSQEQSGCGCSATIPDWNQPIWLLGLLGLIRRRRQPDFGGCP
ncbi:MAG: hypothetical protein QGG40_07430 [Myxococcota bacterium]|nr:hypothetical protein [Myxococcota bacterium]